MGLLTVRRRREPTLDIDVYEVKLGDEFLMSSLFTVAEIALADLGLAAVAAEGPLDVVVGGLGLGYTARAVLASSRVGSLRVVEALGAVIEWHRHHLLPQSHELIDDERCALVHGDFFAMVAGGGDFGAGAPARVHAILVDIDHSPTHLLHPDHGAFYEAAGLAGVVDRLHPGGVFGLWADGAPDEAFLDRARTTFSGCEAHTVSFPNVLTGAQSSSTVYLART